MCTNITLCDTTTNDVSEIVTPPQNTAQNIEIKPLTSTWNCSVQNIYYVFESRKKINLKKKTSGSIENTKEYTRNTCLNIQLDERLDLYFHIWIRIILIRYVKDIWIEMLV